MKKFRSNVNTFNLLLFLIPLIPYYSVLPEVINSIVFICISIIFVIYSFKNLKAKDSYWMVIFILGLLSALFSKDKVLSFVDAFELLVFIPVYLYARSFDKEKLKDSFIYIFYGGIATAVFSIFRYCLNSDLRLDGMFNYANTTALYFVICFIIYFSIDIESQTKSKKVLQNLGVEFILTAFFLTQSRGGIVVYLFSIITIIILGGKRKSDVFDKIVVCNMAAFVLAYSILSRQYVILVLILPLIILIEAMEIKVVSKNKKIRQVIYGICSIAFVALFINTFARVKQLSIGSGQLQERLVFFKDGLKALTNNPFGIGSGRWTSVQFNYQSAFYDIKYVHNGFLQIALDFGVIFLIFYMVILFYSILTKSNKEKERYNYFLIITVIIIHSLVDFSMSFIYINIILWLAIGALKVEKVKADIKDKKMKNTHQSNKGFTYAFITSVIVLDVLIAIVLPSEIIYNIASISKDTKVSYSLMNTLIKMPFKEQRYYDKLASVSISLYSDTGEKSYIKDAINSMEKAVLLQKENYRNYEVIGKAYYKEKDYKRAAMSLEKSVEYRKFYLPNYDVLIESYYALYKEGNISAKDYLSKVKNIESNIIKLKDQLNIKSVYMKDQPDGKLNDFEKIRIGQAYRFIGDLENYDKYVNLVGDKSLLKEAE